MTRVSADPKSPHHWALQFDEPPLVILSGMEMHHVAEADDVEGWVDCLVTSGSGSNKIVGEEFRVRRSEGRVRIEVRGPSVLGALRSVVNHG